MPKTCRHPFTTLFVLHTAASLAHFTQNAEVIAIYPGLPIWMTRESVYMAWLAVAVAASVKRWHCVAALLFIAYGLLGTDGLLRYTLALCSEHTLATNLTTWAEVTLGIVLACAAAVRLSRLALLPVQESV